MKETKSYSDQSIKNGIQAKGFKSFTILNLETKKYKKQLKREANKFN